MLIRYRNFLAKQAVLVAFLLISLLILAGCLQTRSDQETLLPTLSPSNTPFESNLKVQMHLDEGYDIEWGSGDNELFVSSPESISKYTYHDNGFFVVYEWLAEYPSFLTISSDGRSFIYSDEMKIVYIGDMDKPNHETLLEDTGTVTGLAINGDGSKFAVAYLDGRLLIYDYNADLINNISVSAWVENLIFSPNGKFIGALDKISRTYSIFDIATGKLQNSILIPDEGSPSIHAAYPSSDWLILAVISSGRVVLLDMLSGDEMNSFEHDDAITGFDWSPDSELIITSSIVSNDNRVYPTVFVWNSDSGELMHSIELDDGVIDLSVARSDNIIGILKSSGELEIWAGSDYK